MIFRQIFLIKKLFIVNKCAYMVTRTFLDKCTTIFEGSKDNFGLNPIGVLNYGNLLSRCLIHFDENNIKKMVDEGYDIPSLKHTLLLTNCGSIDQKRFDEKLIDSSIKERATSFTVILFKIQELWDEGVGFDKSDDFWFLGKGSSSQNGCNWYQPCNGFKWKEEGIYSRERLQNEYDNFREGKESIIIAEQHFDHGNENFKFDITDYVNEILSGDVENYGLGMAFIPILENTQTKYTQYVGFFTNNTNTFFHPVVETRSTEIIEDSRMCFDSGKSNKLYFYAVLGGEMVDLDENPICIVDGQEYEAKRQKRGVYYADVKLPKSVEAETIVYDTWTNLKYDGQEIDDVEMSFVAKPSTSTFGQLTSNERALEPILYGINDDEKVYQGDERRVVVNFRVPYTSSKYELISGAQYRLYVKSGTREVDVIDWDSIDIAGVSNSFLIKTKELIPQEYYIDIKGNFDGLTRIFKNKLRFRVVDNITEIKK